MSPDNGHNQVFMLVLIARIPKYLLLFTLWILSICAFTFSGNTQDAWAVDRIVAAVPTDFPPSYYRDPVTGKPVGFAIDVMNEVAQRAGLTVEYVYGESWYQIQEMLLSGKADVIPNFTVDKDRKKRLGFTKPVETVYVSYVVRKDQKVTELVPGMRIGTIRGSAAHNYLLASAKDIVVVPEEGLQHLLFNLLAGQIDMVLTATPNLLKLASDAGVEERIRILEPPVFESVRAMALRSADFELRQRLDLAIDELVKSETYHTIYEKWWGKPKPFWTPPRVLMLAIFLIGSGGLLSTVWWFRATAIHNILLQEALELAERERIRSKSILESVSDGISIHDRDLRIIYQNPRLVAMMGEHAGEHCYLAYRNQDSICEGCPVLDTFDTGRQGSTTFSTTTPAGLNHFEMYSSPIRNERGKIVSVISSLRDITERKKAEEERLKDLVFIETLMKDSPMGIRVFDAETADCVMANHASAKLAGGAISDLERQNFRKLSSWQDSGLLPAAESVLSDGTSRTVEAMLSTTFGKEVVVAYFFSRFICNDNSYLLVMGWDITEKTRIEEENKRIEKQLLQTQKLESLGILAGGIAHDFNNILTSIVGNADLALTRLNPESPVLENLLRIEKAALRATDLAKQMLAYSGKGKFVVEPIDLNRLVEEMGHMLEVSISKKAVLRFDLTRPLPAVEADATQLRQVVMNLVINASEAIGDKSGVIAINTGCILCDERYLKSVWLNQDLPAGEYLYLEIVDTGCGMSKETLAKIFDPFFTTKFAGRGLGMAAVQGIVRGHSGAIKVYSEPGKGTSFKLLLPTSDRSPEMHQVGDPLHGWKGSGIVLLADDEETVRAIGTEMLKELGFEVVTANNGQEAVDIYRERDDIALVILDLTMPHLDGEQAFRTLRTIDPAVKVVVSSGYSEFEVSQKFVGRGLAGFIQKPYRLSTLRDVIMNIEPMPVAAEPILTPTLSLKEREVEPLAEG